MTPTEAIASIRASLAAGYSPSLSDIEVLIAECGRVEVLERACKNAKWLVSDVREHLLGPFHEMDEFGATSINLKQVVSMLDTALTTQSPRNENG